MRQSFLSISKLSEKPYAIIIGYPKATKRQVESRIAQMKKLGINSISFQGDLKLGSINVLGKGYVGIVVLAKKQKKKVAVKIRRTDSQRKEMQSEAKLLKISNSVRKIYKIPSKDKMIEVLRNYKYSPTRESFDKLLKVLKL